MRTAPSGPHARRRALTRRGLLGGGRGLLGGLVGRLLVAAREALDTASGVDDLLLAGEERMAVAADLDVQLRSGGAGHEGVAARAAHDLGQHVARVDALLHRSTPAEARTRDGDRRAPVRIAPGLRPAQTGCGPCPRRRSAPAGSLCPAGERGSRQRRRSFRRTSSRRGVARPNRGRCGWNRRPSCVPTQDSLVTSIFVTRMFVSNCRCPRRFRCRTLLLYRRMSIFSPFRLPVTSAVTETPARRGVPIRTPWSSANPTTSSSSAEPFSVAARPGTEMVSPSVTRYCLPPARTTAYKDTPSVDDEMTDRQKVVAHGATREISVGRARGRVETFGCPSYPARALDPASARAPSSRRARS